MLTDGDEIVSVMCCPPFSPRKIDAIHFCLRMSQPQGHTADGMFTPTEKFSDLIGNGTSDLPPSSIVPQPTTLPRALYPNSILLIFFYIKF
jgi:hypothetical protein